jgi:hypothetical protein
MIKTYVSKAFVGIEQAYIYLWYSRAFKIIYVGMTNNRVGTIGRASQHLNPNGGTLRKRFYQAFGQSIEEVDDLILLSFPLPRKREYFSEESSYREAVEYLVQRELLLRVDSFQPSYKVISWVRGSPRTTNSEVIGLASSIVEEFANSFEHLY